jgi:hypothetical protein
MLSPSSFKMCSNKKDLFIANSIVKDLFIANSIVKDLIFEIWLTSFLSQP